VKDKEKINKAARKVNNKGGSICLIANSSNWINED
jgi:hypothetical protein